MVKVHSYQVYRVLVGHRAFTKCHTSANIQKRCGTMYGTRTRAHAHSRTRHKHAHAHTHTHTHTHSTRTHPRTRLTPTHAVHFMHIGARRDQLSLRAHQSSLRCAYSLTIPHLIQHRTHAASARH